MDDFRNSESLRISRNIRIHGIWITHSDRESSDNTSGRTPTIWCWWPSWPHLYTCIAKNPNLHVNTFHNNCVLGGTTQAILPSGDMLSTRFTSVHCRSVQSLLAKKFHLFAAQKSNSFMRFTRYFDLMRYGCSVFGCVAKDAWPPATSNQMKSSVTWRLSKTPIQMRYKKETTLSHPTHTGCLNQDAQIGSNQKTMRTIGPYGLRLKCNSVLNQLVNHLTNKTQACEVPPDSPFGQRCEIAFETRKGREPGELDWPPFPGGSLHSFWPHTKKLKKKKRHYLVSPKLSDQQLTCFLGYLCKQMFSSSLIGNLSDCSGPQVTSSSSPSWTEHRTLHHFSRINVWNEFRIYIICIIYLNILSKKKWLIRDLWTRGLMGKIRPSQSLAP